jgi:hypothetical protein
MADDRPSETSRTLHTTLGAVRTEVKALQTDVSEMKADVSELAKAGVEHRVRLENGTAVFSSIRERMTKSDSAIADISERIRPKPPSITKVVTITLGLVVVGAGALWGLSNMLRDRPTVEQVDQVFQRYDDSHEAAGHKELREDVHSIQKEQVLQGVKLQDVQKQQGTDSEKLDKVLERLPAPRRRHTP